MKMVSSPECRLWFVRELWIENYRAFGEVVPPDRKHMLPPIWLQRNFVSVQIWCSVHAAIYDFVRFWWRSFRCLHKPVKLWEYLCLFTLFRIQLMVNNIVPTLHNAGDRVLLFIFRTMYMKLVEIGDCFCIRHVREFGGN